MPSNPQHTPVVLVLDKRGKDIDPIDEWLAESRYETSEAADVFQVLEQLSDFTVRERPDLVFVHVDSLASDLLALRKLTKTSVDEPDVPIVMFGAGDARKDSKFASLADRLDMFIPQRHKTTERDA
jgi:PleD family two-component response regulator